MTKLYEFVHCVLLLEDVLILECVPLLEFVLILECVLVLECVLLLERVLILERVVILEGEEVGQVGAASFNTGGGSCYNEIKNKKKM
jgi:hypothetical protein